MGKGMHSSTTRREGRPDVFPITKETQDQAVSYF
jgi:hypothetical protein